MNHSEPSPNRPKHLFWWIWGSAMLLFSLGCVAGDQNVNVGEIGICGSDAEHWGEGRGQAGYLAFYHSVDAVDLTTDPGYYEFDPYLMEGSFGTYYVSHWQTGEPARIVDVRSSDPDVISISALYDGSFDVEAVSPGSAELRVETDAGVSDRIELYVTDLDQVAFNHCCADSSHAYYLTGSEVEIPVTYYDSYGETPIGYGRFPFRISDETKLSWIAGVPDPADIHLKTGERAGNVTLTPTVSGAPLTLELIAPSEVDGISVHWKADPYASGLWFIGGVLYRGNTPLCAGKYPMRVETLTPSVCQLVDSDNRLAARLNVNGDQSALIEERSDGECRVNVQLLDDRGGVVLEQEASREFSYRGSRDSY